MPNKLYANILTLGAGGLDELRKSIQPYFVNT